MKKIDFTMLKNSKRIEIEYLNIDEIITNDFVKNLRNKLNMTQIVFAKTLGVSKKTIEKWEQGKNKITGLNARLLYVIDKDELLLNNFRIVKEYNFEFSSETLEKNQFEDIPQAEYSVKIDYSPKKKNVCLGNLLGQA